VTAADTLTADGSNLAAVLARMKAETATDLRPQGVLSDIAAELNHLIPGVTRLDASLHDASREYRIELTMRDGLPFTSRVISDGTLRVLALLTLLHDPKHRGLVCFEEPENGVHPGRVKTLVQRLQDMVSRPRDDMDAGVVPPLSQLLLNSHSPVVLAALLDSAGHPVDEGGAILFADTSSVTDPAQGQTRRRTRLRPIRQLDGLFASEAMERGAVVSDLEVRQVLDAVRAEG
jgi:predicted ATPase